MSVAAALGCGVWPLLWLWLWLWPWLLYRDPDDLAEVIMRRRKGEHLRANSEQRRVRGDRRLHLPWADGLSTALDGLARAPREVQPAVVVEPSEIAREEERHMLLLLWATDVKLSSTVVVVVVVASKELRCCRRRPSARTNGDRADMPRRRNAAVLAQHMQRDASTARRPDAAGTLERITARRRRNRHALAHRVRRQHHHTRAERLAQLYRRRMRERRAAGAHQPQRVAASLLLLRQRLCRCICRHRRP